MLKRHQRNAESLSCLMDETIKPSEGIGSYRSTLKSTSLIGGASVLNILINMVRIKFVAILLGPNGVGLIGLYTQITTVASTATGMGIGCSGVRQVAEAVGTGDEEKIARTVITLRRMAWLTGGFGLLVLALFSVPISRITFNTADYSIPIALLGFSLLFTAITVGQSCILRGTRRILEVAKVTVIGALCGTLVSIPCFYYWGVKGVVPSIILSTGAALTLSWWYARKVSITSINMTWIESFSEARTLLTLGLSFMGAGLVSSFTTYLIQVTLVRQFSLTGFGIYQAGYSLSGVLVGFVLGAMGSDYYPRLTAVARDNARVRSILNEQSKISILLALPGLVAMMVFAPLVVQMFYATSFVAAVPLLRWCLLGVLGRVFSWPLGFVMLAQGKGKLFFVTEAFSCGLHLSFVVFFTHLWGIGGAGIGFMAVYIVYTGLLVGVIRKLIGAVWDLETVKLVVIASIIMGLLMLNCTIKTEFIITWSINLVALVLTTCFCLKSLAETVGLSLRSLLIKTGLKQDVRK